MNEIVHFLPPLKVDPGHTLDHPKVQKVPVAPSSFIRLAIARETDLGDDGEFSTTPCHYAPVHVVDPVIAVLPKDPHGGDAPVPCPTVD